MLPNLLLRFFFIYLIIESYKKVFIRHFVISSIVIYCTIIIPNIPNKIVNCREFSIVKYWLIQLGVNRPVLLKYYLCLFLPI